jgi:hypothetical protein
MIDPAEKGCGGEGSSDSIGVSLTAADDTPVSEEMQSTILLGD